MSEIKAVVIEIGRLECGEERNLVGAYETEEEAYAVAHALGGHYNGGAFDYVAFRITGVGTTDEFKDKVNVN